MIENVPMFDVAPVAVRKQKARNWPGPQSLRRVLCAGGAHTAGLILSEGDHLTWRPHLVHTVGGSAWDCPVAGKCLCVEPSPVVAGKHNPTCHDHGTWSS
jgi:hypothetical protein